MSLVVLRLSYARMIVLIVMFVKTCVDASFKLAIVNSALFTATSCPQYCHLGNAVHSLSNLVERHKRSQDDVAIALRT